MKLREKKCFYLQIESMIRRNCLQIKVQHRSRMNQAALCKGRKCIAFSSWRYSCMSRWSDLTSSLSSSSCSSSSSSAASSRTNSPRLNHQSHEQGQSSCVWCAGQEQERIPGLSQSPPWWRLEKTMKKVVSITSSIVSRYRDFLDDCCSQKFCFGMSPQSYNSRH